MRGRRRDGARLGADDGACIYVCARCRFQPSNSDLARPAGLRVRFSRVSRTSSSGLSENLFFRAFRVAPGVIRSLINKASMSCPQSLLQQLLGGSSEEAIKTLNVWRANYSGNKRVTSDPSSIAAISDLPRYDPVVYDQIFRPPPPKLREKNKLYGRDFLLKQHPEQYRVLYVNYGEVRKWFAKGEAIGNLRNNNERKNVVLRIIKENIATLKAITIDGVSYPWKEEDLYTWCIKSLAAKRKWSKKKTSQETLCSTNSMVLCMDDDNITIEHKDEKDDQEGELHATIESSHVDEQVTKFVVDHKADDISNRKDEDVYIPDMSWMEEDDPKSAYEEYQHFIRDESSKVSLQGKETHIDHEGGGNGDNVTKKDKSLSESCAADDMDASSRKSNRKRKVTSKLKDLLEEKDKASKEAKHKKKESLREDGGEKSLMEIKARTLSTRDKEVILMKWLHTQKVEEIYQLIKPTYCALKKTHSFFGRKVNDTTSSTMCEDLVAWLLVEGVVHIDFSKLGVLTLKDVHLCNDD
ncbi:hypothetical protein GOP47_0004303 [Adiantum capillus-veneris]|uniref:Uncharacterized protein n=1 Tax=Adiantum capillus-veneris TaxID=13818 RepID=A0A9D4V795_ADICA|nr:hypothetical protein GOP47_0004303 [Adiantum capillus-veneris]